MISNQILMLCSFLITNKQNNTIRYDEAWAKPLGIGKNIISYSNPIFTNFQSLITIYKPNKIEGILVENKLILSPNQIEHRQECA